MPLDADGALTAEVGRLAAVLQDKKWRDKDEFLDKVAALLPQGAAAGRDAGSDAGVGVEAVAADDELSSGDF